MIAQHDELCKWSSDGATLGMAAESVSAFVQSVVMWTNKVAPESNLQASMVQMEVDMHLKAMKATLRYCAVN